MVVVPRKTVNLKKWVEIKKNDLCDQNAQDGKVVGPNILHVQDARICGSSIDCVRF